MPAWAKVLLSVVVAGIVTLVAVGVIVVKTFNRTIEATERAGAEGRGFGFAESIERCTEEGVRRSSQCDGFTCGMQVHAFMWGCLDNATYDEDYCASVAPLEDGAAVTRWTVATCAEYGQPDNENCRFALTVVPSYCYQASGT
jgi:hypothetical protein